MGHGVLYIINPLAAIAEMSPNYQKLYLFYTPTEYSRGLVEEAQKRINSRIENSDPGTALSSIQAQLQTILNCRAEDTDALNQL